MAVATREAPGIGSGVDVAAMADVVRELVAGGSSRVASGEWLRARAAAVDLTAHEHAALEALRTRLAGGGGFLDALADNPW